MKKMQKLKLSFSFLVCMIIYLSLSTVVFGEGYEQRVATPSQEVPYAVEINHTYTDSISWLYDYEGTPYGLTGISSPLITYYIDITGDDNYKLSMLVDGVEVDAQYDKASGYLTYQANNLIGTHTVSIELEVYGKKKHITSWDFTVDRKPVDPFKGKNLNLLSSVQKESILRLNKYRNELSLPFFSENELLHRAAQAHSNYLATNHVIGHYENMNKVGYTGNGSQDRASYFGFNGSVGEGITYQQRTGSSGVDNLMDAPYHRLNIINPHDDLAGIGYNNQGDIVINYGSYADSEKEPEVVLYPYNQQKDAKISWYVSENPNPLRFWGIDKTYVGYPISYAYFPANSTDQLIVKKLSLKDENNKNVSFYDVTPSRDDHSEHHVFIIPKSPLKVDYTYFVNVEAYVKDDQGNIRDVSRSWSFKTASVIDIHDIYFEKYMGTNFIKVKFNNGEDPSSIIKIEKKGKLYIKYVKKKQWTYQTMTEGDYTLTIESPLFKDKKIIPITVKKNKEMRHDSDGDWSIIYKGKKVQK